MGLSSVRPAGGGRPSPGTLTWSSPSPRGPRSPVPPPGPGTAGACTCPPSPASVVLGGGGAPLAPPGCPVGERHRAGLGPRLAPVYLAALPRYADAGWVGIIDVGVPASPPADGTSFSVGSGRGPGYMFGYPCRRRMRGWEPRRILTSPVGRTGSPGASTPRTGSGMFSTGSALRGQRTGCSRGATYRDARRGRRQGTR